MSAINYDFKRKASDEPKYEEGHKAGAQFASVFQDGHGYTEHLASSASFSHPVNPEYQWASNSHRFSMADSDYQPPSHSTEYQPGSAQYKKAFPYHLESPSPFLRRISPNHVPGSHDWFPTSSTLKPRSPVYEPTSPTLLPHSPHYGWVSVNPQYRPQSPRFDQKMGSGFSPGSPQLNNGTRNAEFQPLSSHFNEETENTQLSPQSPLFTQETDSEHHQDSSKIGREAGAGHYTDSPYHCNPETTQYRTYPSTQYQRENIKRQYQHLYSHHQQDMGISGISATTALHDNLESSSVVPDLQLNLAEDVPAYNLGGKYLQDYQFDTTHLVPSDILGLARNNASTATAFSRQRSSEDEDCSQSAKRHTSYQNHGLSLTSPIRAPLASSSVKQKSRSIARTRHHCRHQKSRTRKFLDIVLREGSGTPEDDVRVKTLTPSSLSTEEHSQEYHDASTPRTMTVIEKIVAPQPQGQLAQKIIYPSFANDINPNMHGSEDGLTVLPDLSDTSSNASESPIHMRPCDSPILGDEEVITSVVSSATLRMSVQAPDNGNSTAELHPSPSEEKVAGLKEEVATLNTLVGNLIGQVAEHEKEISIFKAEVERLDHVVVKMERDALREEVEELRKRN